MTASVKSELDGIKERIISLSMEGKYGQAVLLLKQTMEVNATLMASNDDWSDFCTGFICMDTCIHCGDGGGGGCFGLYCVGLMACLCCCGEDAASACFCDPLSNCCTSCLHSGGC